MYMQSGHKGTIRSMDLPRISKEEDRERLQSEPISSKMKYVNFNKGQLLNLRLPGSEYGELDMGGNASAAVAGKEERSGSDVDTRKQEDAYCAGFSGDEEDLYTAMA